MKKLPLTAVAWALYAAGWAAASIVLAWAWVVAAIQLGWKDAHKHGTP